MTRNPFPRQIDFGLSGPVPRDLIAILVVLFATFSLSFFKSTEAVPAALILTPEVWHNAQVWRLATYPFVGTGTPGVWILVQLFILYIFGKDVYFGLYRRHFWRLIAFAALGAGLIAVGVHALVTTTGLMEVPLPFVLIRGQLLLTVIFVAAFATAHTDATIFLFFILPVRAAWFLWLELVFGFIGFLSTRDLPGFLGICVAVAIANLYVRSNGALGKGSRRTFREMRLRLERWWIQKKLERNRRKRGFRIIDGERDRNVRKGPWVN